MTRLFSLAQIRVADAYALLRREDGQGTVEYAFLILGVIALAGLVAAFVAPGVQSLFQNINW